MDERANFVTVVSGLPRSGTSLMMRILERAGVPLVVDGLRRPDRDNPHGYFEYERVKELERDASWLDACRGRAVKAIYRFLPHLPDHLRYRILFMQRNLDEVLRSQDAMVQRLTGEIASADDAALIRLAFERELVRVREVVARRANMQLLNVDYNALIADPPRVLVNVVAFLDLRCAPADLLACVDGTLYRNRALGESVVDGSGAAEEPHP